MIVKIINTKLNKKPKQFNISLKKNVDLDEIKKDYYKSLSITPCSFFEYLKRKKLRNKIVKDKKKANKTIIIFDS